jgi:L-seryl-tRNA(Ser) seleniumtransferase
VSASGDKLLGGPQAGILVGKAAVIERLKKHPLARALRLDKMTLAALEVTLRLYLDPERARREVPVLRMLTESADQVRLRAGRMACGIDEACGDATRVSVREDVSRAGGGALPMADVPTFVVAVEPRDVSVVELESRLRLGEPHVVARISEDRLLIDPRTLTEAEELEVTSAVARAVLG